LLRSNRRALPAFHRTLLLNNALSVKLSTRRDLPSAQCRQGKDHCAEGGCLLAVVLEGGRGGAHKRVELSPQCQAQDGVQPWGLLARRRVIVQQQGLTAVAGGELLLPEQLRSGQAALERGPGDLYQPLLGHPRFDGRRRHHEARPESGAGNLDGRGQEGHCPSVPGLGDLPRCRVHDGPGPVPGRVSGLLRCRQAGGCEACQQGSDERYQSASHRGHGMAGTVYWSSLPVAMRSP